MCSVRVSVWPALMMIVPRSSEVRLRYERTAADPFASCLATFMLGANRSDNVFERLLPTGSPDRP